MECEQTWVAKPLRLPFAPAAVKIWFQKITGHPGEADEVHVWWEQRYFVQLLNSSDGPANFKQHRVHEKGNKVIERIINEYDLPDEATC